MSIVQSEFQYSGLDPRIFQGCVLWLDAADSNTITQSGSTVTAWRDKSGNGSNTTVTGTPSVTSNINSVRTITTGTGNYFTGSVSITSTTLTCFAVARTTRAMPNTGGDQRLVSLANGVNVDYGRTDSCIALFNQGGSGNISTYRVNSHLASNAITQNTPFIAVSQYSGTTASLWLNGTAGSLASSASSGTFAITKYGIGNQANPTTEVWSGDIGEIILFNSAITSNQRQQIEGYLAWKWKLTSSLGSTHPYKSLAPFTRPFQPVDVNGCILWLDAQDRSAMTFSGTNITAWNDKSGYGSNFTASLNPVVGTVSNASIIDTTGGGYFYNGSFSVPTTYSVITVGYSTVAAVSNTWAGMLYATPDAIFMLRAFQGSNYIFKGNGGVWGTNSGTYPNATVQSIWSITNPTAAGAMTLYTNGSTSNTQTNSTVTNGASAGLDIGRWVNNSYPWKGYIGDVIFYNAGLSDSNLRQLEGYIAWKYNLRANLPTIHPYRNFAPLVPVFNPLQLSGCQLWLDGADPNALYSDSGGTTLASVGGTIGYWKDKSTTGRHYTQATAANRPSYSSSGTITFSGSAQLTNTSTWTTGVNYAIFVVVKPLTSTATWRTLLRGATTDHPVLVQAGTTNLGYFANGSTGFNQFGTLTLDGTQVAILHVNITSTRVYTAALNGTLTMSSAASTGGADTQPFYFLGTVNSSQPWGDIKEVIIYQATLDRQERQRVEGYLAWKWKLQAGIPTTHAYYKISP